MSHLYDLAVAFSKKSPPPGAKRSATEDWRDACGALVNQFTLYAGGWAKNPSAYGPNARVIGDHSGPLNTNAAAAPISAFHFWYLDAGGADDLGHVGRDLNGGGTDILMATGRAVKVRLAPYLGIQSVAGYNATGARYRGWSTNYYGGISGYVEPAPAPTATQRQVAGKNAVRRDAPATSGKALGSPLLAGSIQTPKGFITTDTPVTAAGGTSPVWLVFDGFYSALACFTDLGTHDLTDLTPTPVDPTPEPEPAPIDELDPTPDPATPQPDPTPTEPVDEPAVPDLSDAAAAVGAGDDETAAQIITDTNQTAKPSNAGIWGGIAVAVAGIVTFIVTLFIH